MKSSTVTLVFVFGVGVALAQTSSSTSSHSGWSIQDTLETAPDIVVGTVAASDCADSGAEVSCRATVRILRVVKGGLAPQANIQVHWDYHPGPLDGPEATRHVPDVTALWCLRSAADGGYAPLTVSFMPTYGGAFLRVPAEPPGGDFFYATDASPEYKIAREVGAAMVAEGRAADKQLGLQTRSLPGASFFLAQILSNLPASAAADVYTSLARSPSATLEAVGISGRLRAGDASALIELDRDLPRFSNTSAMREIGANIPTLKLRGQPAAAQALARLALSEIEIPLLEHFAPMLLAGTKNLEFLPVLIAMLQSPSSDVRGEALSAACTLLRAREPALGRALPAEHGRGPQWPRREYPVLDRMVAIHPDPGCATRPASRPAASRALRPRRGASASAHGNPHGDTLFQPNAHDPSTVALPHGNRRVSRRRSHWGRGRVQRAHVRRRSCRVDCRVEWRKREAGSHPGGRHEDDESDSFYRRAAGHQANAGAQSAQNGGAQIGSGQPAKQALTGRLGDGRPVSPRDEHSRRGDGRPAAVAARHARHCRRRLSGQRRSAARTVAGGGAPRYGHA